MYIFVTFAALKGGDQLSPPCPLPMPLNITLVKLTYVLYKSEKEILVYTQTFNKCYYKDKFKT